MILFHADGSSCEHGAHWHQCLPGTCTRPENEHAAIVRCDAGAELGRAVIDGVVVARPPYGMRQHTEPEA